MLPQGWCGNHLLQGLFISLTFDVHGLSDEGFQLWHVRAGDGDAVMACPEGELIAVGVALCAGDVVHVDDKRPVAAEDVFIILQVFHHGGQRGVYFLLHRLAVFQVADADIVLAGLDIQQVVDGYAEVVSTDVGVMDGDKDVFLLLRGIAQQSLHFSPQETVVVDADGGCGNENTDGQRPIQERDENAEGDGITEDKGEKDAIADGDEKQQAKYGKPLMPDAPGFDVLEQVLEHQPFINGTAACRDNPEKGRHQEFVSLISAEAERLEHIEYRPDGHAIGEAVSQPVLALLEGVCSGKE